MSDNRLVFSFMQPIYRIGICAHWPLIRFIVGMNLIPHGYRKLFGGSRASNIEEFDRTTPLSNEDIERIWDFERVYSDFYPELEEWYDIQNFIWLVRKKIEII